MSWLSMAKDAKILIFDEATSALDQDTEIEIRDGGDEYIKGVIKEIKPSSEGDTNDITVEVNIIDKLSSISNNPIMIDPHKKEEINKTWRTKSN